MNTVDRLYHAMHPLHAGILVYTLLAFNYCDPSEYWFSCNYRNSHYFRSQIFHVRNFRVTIFSSISRMRHIFATYNTIGK